MSSEYSLWFTWKMNDRVNKDFSRIIKKTDVFIQPFIYVRFNATPS